jgi:intraflagellar transport protein 81
MLKKRAYLAPFLVNTDIPPELILEDDVNLLHTQFDVLQDHFKVVHKHLENIRKKDKDPVLLKGSIQGLEVEKNHLSTKIQNLKTELQVSI